MIKIAVRLLKSEKKNAINLCVSIASTITVCLIFMQILKSPYISGNAIIENSNFIYSALLTFFMIFMCVILMIYSSNYFIRIKSREMGLIILAGLSSFKITLYNLIQVLCIVLVSSLFGCGIFLVINPVIQAVIYYLLQIEANIFYLNIEALWQGLAVVFSIIFVIMLFNSGFLVRTGITELLENHNIISYKKDTRVIKPPNIFYVLLYGFGLLCMYTGNNQVGGYIVFSLFGAVGAYGMFRHYLPHHYNKKALKQCRSSDQLLIKEDVSLLMQQSKSFILILMVAMIGLVPFICGTVDNRLLHFELNLAFIVANILLSITLVNRFKIDHIQRKDHFHTIYQLGYTKENIIKLYLQEINYYFIHIWLLSIIYIINIFIIFFFNQGMSLITIVIILIEYMVPYFLAQIIILYERKKEINHDKQYT